MSVEGSPSSPVSPVESSPSEVQKYWEQKYETPNYAEMDDEEFHLMMNSHDSYGDSLFADPVFNFGVQNSYVADTETDQCCVLGSYSDHGRQVSDLGIQSALDLTAWEKSIEGLLTSTDVDTSDVTGHHSEEESSQELMNRFTEEFWTELSEPKEERSENDPGDPSKCENFMSISDPFDMSKYSDDINGPSGDARAERALFENSIYADRNYVYSLKDDTDLRNDKVWSIFTDTLSYVDCDALCVTHDISSTGELRNEISAKQKYFSADNTNEPSTSRPKYKQKYKVHKVDSKAELFDSGNCNEPNLNDRYPEVKAQLNCSYNPEHDISTTYLWSTQKGKEMAKPVKGSWFMDGNIEMDMYGKMKEAYLLDGTPIKFMGAKVEDCTPVRTLSDSGATKSMLNRNFYLKNKSLHKYPIYQIKPRTIKIANSQHIVVKECIHMMIRFGEHVFEIIAYLSDMLREYDMIIGQKTMYELEGGVSFGNMEFNFRMRSVDLSAVKDVKIAPGEKKTFELKLDECPDGLYDAKDLIVKKGNYPKLLSVT